MSRTDVMNRLTDVKLLGAFVDMDELTELLLAKEYEEAMEYLNFCEEHKDC
jgi:hypothetical protein